MIYDVFLIYYIQYFDILNLYLKVNILIVNWRNFKNIFFKGMIVFILQNFL